MGYIHLGIDYGTSASKILVRDYDSPGGERVHPLMFRGSFRVPSDIAVARGRLYLGRTVGDSDIPSDARWYRSVKMRVAAEHGVFIPGRPFEQQAPPDGWTFDMLAVISVAWLIQRAQDFAEKVVNPQAKNTYGMTMGIPSDFRLCDGAKNAFRIIAMAAWRVARGDSKISEEFELTGAIRDQVASAVRHASAVAIDEDETKQWIRSEARASIWWAWRSPKLVTAPYIKIDVGAGTTNVAAFLIQETARRNRRGGRDWVKYGIAVLGAASGTVGTNALLAAAAYTSSKGFPPLAAVLGQPVLRKPLEHPYRLAMQQVFQRTGGAGAAYEQWRGAHVMMLGGGSLSQDICGVFGFHPRMPSHRFVPVVFNIPPPDLKLGTNVSVQPHGASLRGFYQPHGATPCSGTWGHPRGG